MAGFGQLKGVIWDMDGVIVDSWPAHLESWKSALAHYDISVADQELQETFGMTSPQVIRELTGDRLDETTVAKINNKKEKIFRSIIKKEAVYLPGSREWLTTFRKNNILQALASSAPQKNIATVLEALDARKYFDAIVSGFGMPSKPAPDVFLHAAEELGIDVQDCVVIEDAIAGVEAARTAGMKCIALITTHPAGKLKNAHLILEDLRALDREKLLSLFNYG